MFSFYLFSIIRIKLYASFSMYTNTLNANLPAQNHPQRLHPRKTVLCSGRYLYFPPAFQIPFIQLTVISGKHYLSLTMNACIQQLLAYFQLSRRRYVSCFQDFYTKILLTLLYLFHSIMSFSI